MVEAADPPAAMTADAPKAGMTTADAAIAPTASADPLSIFLPQPSFFG